MARIYCAGPLFTWEEQTKMRKISNLIERNGHETFLPQRDGLELKKVEPIVTKKLGCESASRQLVHKAIFSLDLWRLLDWSEGIVANLNGRVPDEGTIVEVAMAWHSNKALVLYKNDPRAPFKGHDNPMLTGLTNDYIVSSLTQIPTALNQSLLESRQKGVKEKIQDGARLATALSQAPKNPIVLSKILMEWGSKKGR